MRDDDERRGRGPEEGFQRLARRDIQVVGRLVEQQEVCGCDPKQRELEPGPLASGQLGHRREDVVAAEQEPREVPARLTGREVGAVEQRVEDCLTRKRGASQLCEVPELDAVPEGHDPVQRKQLARDGPQECRLPGAVGTDDSDAVAPANLEPGDPEDGMPSAAPGSRGNPTTASRTETTTSPDRTGPPPTSPPCGSFIRRPGRGASTCRIAASRRSCSCIFEKLRWLR